MMAKHANGVFDTNEVGRRATPLLKLPAFKDQLRAPSFIGTGRLLFYWASLIWLVLSFFRNVSPYLSRAEETDTHRLGDGPPITPDHDSRLLS